MQITFLQKEYDQSYNMNKTFSSNINIVPSNNSGSLMKADRDTIGYAIINDFENRNVSTYSNNTNGYVFTNNSIDGEKIIYIQVVAIIIMHYLVGFVGK